MKAKSTRLARWDESTGKRLAKNFHSFEVIGCTVRNAISCRTLAVYQALHKKQTQKCNMPKSGLAWKPSAKVPSCQVTMTGFTNFPQTLSPVHNHLMTAPWLSAATTQGLRLFPLIPADAVLSARGGAA